MKDKGNWACRNGLIFSRHTRDISRSQISLWILGIWGCMGSRYVGLSPPPFPWKKSLVYEPYVSICFSKSGDDHKLGLVVRAARTLDVSSVFIILLPSFLLSLSYSSLSSLLSFFSFFTFDNMEKVRVSESPVIKTRSDVRCSLRSPKTRSAVSPSLW